MEENKKSDTGILEKLAMITDATQQLFPDGKSLILFELDDHDFKEVQKYFRNIDINHKKFVIDAVAFLTIGAFLGVHGLAPCQTCSHW